MISRRCSRYGHSSRWRYVWLPSVITSAPARKSSSACRGVIPMPPEAFSPLTITKSAPSSSRRPASMVRATRRPAEPTTSPTKRIAVKSGTLVDARRPAHTWGLMQEPRRRRRRRGRGPAARAPAAGSVRAARRTRRRSRSAPVVVPRWVQAVVLPLALLGVYGLLRAAGPVALVFIVAAPRRPAPQPVRGDAPARRRAARPGRGLRLPVPRGRRGRRRRAAGRSGGQPGVELLRQRAGAGRRRQRRARRPAALAGRPRHRRRDPAAGRDGARDARRPRDPRLGRARVVHARRRCRR